MMRLKVAAAAAVLLAAVACSPRQSETPHREAQTIAVTDSLLRCGGSDTVRFGRLHSGEVGVKNFILRNFTGKPVVLVRTETTCSCTSFDYERRPVMPGGETRVTCRFDSSGEWGWQFKLVKLWLSEADEPLRIFVEAEVLYD